MPHPCAALVWPQFAAAVDMLEQAIRAVPEKRWGNPGDWAAPWVLAHHTIFWLDWYWVASDDHRPPAPFGLEELDPAGRLPERVSSQADLLGWLAAVRKRARDGFAALSFEAAERRCMGGRHEMSWLELQLYNLRHVQHGAAQLNLLTRQAGGRPGGWTGRAD